MAQAGQRDFVKYTFYKVAPDWRRLPRADKERSKREFTDVLAEFADRIDLSSYSLVATRGDVDFLLWKVSPSLEAIDQLMAQLNRTELGRFLSTPHSYLAMTRRSPYVDHHQHEGQEGDSTAMRLCLERICPVKRERPISLNLPKVDTTEAAAKSMAVIIAGVASGEILPGEGQALASLVETQRRVIETEELERRIAELERRDG